jgi:hypothetical protein
MKKIKLFGLIAISMFAFASCDLVEDVKDTIDEIQDDQDPAYTESENGLEISVSYKRAGIGIYHIAQFAVNGGDTICTSFVTKTTYPNEGFAKEAYNQAIKDLDEKEKARFTLDGKELTVSHPDNIGLKIATIRFGLKAVYEGYKNGGEIIEDIEIPTDGDGDGDHGQSAGQATYQESPDGLAITVSYNAPTGEGEVVEATFYVSQSEQTDTLLEQIKYYFIYDTPANAEIAYNNNTDGLTRDEIREKQYEVRGNTFSYIEPESAGMPKNQMVIILKGIYARLQQGIIL